MLQLKYHEPIADDKADLGRPEEIRKVFAGVQKYLYRQAARVSRPKILALAG